MRIDMTYGGIMNKQIRWLTKTALLIACTVVVQSLSKLIPLGPYGNFITGSLVNMCLLISASMVGLSSGAIVGIITPFIALLTGTAIPIIFVPFVAIGNFILVLSFHFLKKHNVIHVLVPAAIKSVFLYAAINLMLSAMQLPPEKATAMLYLFSWPQLITAIIGGAMAVFVASRVNKGEGSVWKEG